MRKFVATLCLTMVVIAAAYAATVEMSALKLKGSSSGSITIQATATAGSNTLTAPARTATIGTTTGALTSGNCAKFDASGNVIDAGSPCGTGTGTGDVVGPGSSTAGHFVIFDGTTGKLLKDTLAAPGTAALVNTGTSGATVPLLNGTNTWSGTQTFGTTVSTVTSQSGTSYTLAATDCGTTIAFTSGSSITVTTLNSLAIGCYINILQAGAGQITIANGASATLNSAHSYTKTFGQWAMIGLMVDTNAGSAAHFVLFGDGA